MPGTQAAKLTLRIQNTSGSPFSFYYFNSIRPLSLDFQIALAIVDKIFIPHQQACVSLLRHEVKGIHDDMLLPKTFFYP